MDGLASLIITRSKSTNIIYTVALLCNGETASFSDAL